MKRLGLFALGAFMLVLPGATARNPAAESVKLRAVRFYDAGSGLTQVRAFVQVPLDALTPTGNGSDAVLSYVVGIHLKDSAGATLSETAWPTQQVSASLAEPGITTVKSLEFVLRPGKYRLEVTVQDGASGRTLTAASDLAAYTEPPYASDLVLSPGMRAANTSDTARGTEWRNGSLLVTSAAELVLTPLRSKAYYLLEAYSATPDSGTMTVRIRDSVNQVVVQSPPIQVRVAAGGGVLRGQLDLEGLPAGTYDLDVLVQMGGQQIERTDTFTMMPPGAVLARHAAEMAQLRSTDSGYFAAMDEETIDRAYEPLYYIAENRELRTYAGLSLSAKRRFMTEFWRRRDSDSTTGANERRDYFYGMIAFADSAFRERGSHTQSGWKTDRGRIYAQRGAPDEVLDRVRNGRAPSYLVWRYTRGRQAWYIFSDRSGLGAYKLLRSNDLNEAGAADWGDILGPDAVRDVGLFLGVDFFDGSGTAR